jgi:hypothetical protein
MLRQSRKRCSDERAPNDFIAGCPTFAKLRWERPRGRPPRGSPTSIEFEGAIAGGDPRRLKKALLVIPGSAVLMVGLNLIIRATMHRAISEHESEYTTADLSDVMSQSVPI